MIWKPIISSILKLPLARIKDEERFRYQQPRRGGVSGIPPLYSSGFGTAWVQAQGQPSVPGRLVYSNVTSPVLGDVPSTTGRPNISPRMKRAWWRPPALKFTPYSARSEDEKRKGD